MRLSYFSIALLSAALVRAATPDAGMRTPVVLELFTSEGCSSCPPADELLNTLDERQPYAKARVIVLSEHVDYWDHQGWKDPFSSRLFSDRQNMYAAFLRLPDVYTPQLVIDGRWEALGSDRGAVGERVEQAAASKKVALRVTDVKRGNGQVSFHLASEKVFEGGSANIYVAVAENRVASSVRRGENAGRDFVHVGVVRALNAVGGVKAGDTISTDVAVPVSSEIGASGLRVIALLQRKSSREIIGAAEEPAQ